MSRKDKENRLQRYRELRELGFTSKEANRIKDRSAKKYEQIVKARKEYNRKTAEVLNNGQS